MNLATIETEPLRSYCNSLTQYSRRKTIEVRIGNTPLGGDNPIRIQSMTTVDTMDTEGSVAQSIRMIEAGCEYVRITAPSVKDARNLENIKNELRKRGYTAPLVADIHFTPNAAEIAARIVEKVRINPGNYADKKKFELIEYTDEAYEAELQRIREKFTPLVKICKEYGTAMRIGSNHGFALPDGTWASPWWSELPDPWRSRPHELVEVMVANLCDLVANMPIEIVAHSTFMPSALLRIEDDVHAWWTEELEDRFVEAVVRHRVALEISNRYRLPHDRLLTKALEAGARFSLGSDGHRAQQIANLDWAVETARRIGIGRADMFVPGDYKR